jgi:hypothetical protein
MRIPPATPKEPTAFTLLEIVVAMTVFSFIFISVFGCWRCIVSGKIIAEDAAAAALRARVGMRTVEEALTCAEMSTRNLQFYGFVTDTSGNFASVSLAARLPSDFPGSHLFGDNVMRRVSFDIEKDSGGTNDLVMNQSPLLEALDEVNTPYRITLSRDVNQFMLEFWSVQDGTWIVSWDPTNQLPPMVRVTLGCGHSSRDPNAPYTLIVRTVPMINAHQ